MVRRRLDEEHLNFLSVYLSHVCLTNLIVMISRHRVHSYELSDARLVNLPFFNHELQPNNCLLKPIGQLWLLLRRQLLFH